MFKSRSLLFLALVGLLATPLGAQISLTTLGTPVTQNFDTLATAGTANAWADNTTLPGWYAQFSATPANPTTYRADAGGSNTGAIYSWGTGTATERAFGSVASGTPVNIFNAARLVNNTGATITSLLIAFNGEEWRDGGAVTPVAQTLSFEYQVAAAGVITDSNTPTTGWTAFTSLDFVSPTFTNTGAGAAVDGNAAANRTAKSATLTVSVNPGQEIWLRWKDLNDAGNDHGLGIDDLSVTPNAVAAVNLSVNDVSLNEGNAGTTNFTFTVSLSAPAGPGGVTFDIATADGTAQDDTPATEDNDYVAKSLLAQTIPAGSSTYSFTVLVNGDTVPETNETFFVNVTNVTGATATDGQGQGTIVNDDAAPNLTINDVSLNEGNAGTTSFIFTVSLSAPAGVGGVTFDIATADGTAQDDTPATEDNDYVAKSLLAQTIPAGSSTYAFTVLVNGDTTPEVNETFFVNVTNVTNAIGVDTQGQGTIVNDDLARIHDVQGNGAATPIPGATVTVEGIVTASYQGANQKQGFFLQEEDADIDADPATSEGIFVFCGGCPTAVVEGQRVRVTGTVAEFFGNTEITASTAGSVVVMSSGNPLPTPASIDLPVVGVVNDYYEAREDMRVTFVDTLSVSEYFELARFGQIELFEGGRPVQFTETNPPSVAGYNAHLAALSRRRVILDDDDDMQNVSLLDANGFQFIYPPRANGGFSVGTQGIDFFRGGDLVNGLTGVLDWSFAGITGTDAWRVRPTLANPATFTVANPRPATPPAVGGAIRAVGMNLLNYFTTIDTTSSTSSGPCAPSGTLDCRGADSNAELIRQRERASIVICTLNADVYGFGELENTASASITDLLGAVNTRCGGTHPYAFVNTGGTLGTDAIRVQLIYRTGILSPVGSSLSDLDPIHSRPPTAQTFDVVDAANPAFGRRFTVIANHFKSKGSSAGLPGDADVGDGAGASNATRTAQAARLLTWINSTVLPAAGDPDVLLLGDFNSYAAESPVTTITAGGYTDLEVALLGPSAYSYLFDGQLGHLDYAFSSASLTPQITGIGPWHINADESDLLDYNDEIKDVGEAAFEEKPDGSALVPPRVLFQPATPYRASDHDPVLVGIFQVTDLAITKTDSPDPVTAGNNLTYTITVTNNGPDVATGVSWNDTLPAGTTFVSLPAVAGWSCTTGATVTCSNPSFAVGSAVFTLTVNVGAGVAGGTMLSNTAAVTAATGDPNSMNNSATSTTTVAASADLSITKTDGVTIATPGGSTGYTITVSNPGPSSTTATVTDIFPPSLTCSWICAGTGGGLCNTAVSGDIVDAANLPVGATVTYSASCSISAAATGSLVNTATVVGVASDPNMGNNSATDTDTLVGQADIALAKSVDNASPALGANVVFTVTATNNGPSNATGVAVNDLLPVGLAFVSATPSVGSYSNVTGLWTIGSLANGASATLAITATVNSASAMVNEANKSAAGEVDPRASNNAATVRLNGTPLIDIQITQFVDINTPAIGQDVIFQVTARNAGPATATGILVNSSLPAGVSFVAAGPSQGTYTPGTGSWSVGTLAAGASATLSVRMTNTVSTPVIQTFTKTAAAEQDLVTGNDAASVVLNPVVAQVDLSLTKIAMQEPAAAGQNFSYVIVASNLSAGAATGVVVTDTLPAGVTFVSSAATQGSCTGTTTVTCNLGNLPAGGSATVNLVVTKTIGGKVVNTAMVTGTESDPNSANNTNGTSTTPVELIGFEIE